MNATSHAARPPIMRHNQRLDYETLCDEAAEAVRLNPKQKQEIAEELGRSAAAISRAIREAGPKFAQLQREIIAHLTDYRVEENVIVEFRAVRKEEG